MTWALIASIPGLCRAEEDISLNYFLQYRNAFKEELTQSFSIGLVTIVKPTVAQPPTDSTVVPPQTPLPSDTTTPIGSKPIGSTKSQNSTKQSATKTTSPTSSNNPAQSSANSSGQSVGANPSVAMPSEVSTVNNELDSASESIGAIDDQDEINLSAVKNTSRIPDRNLEQRAEFWVWLAIVLAIIMTIGFVIVVRRRRAQTGIGPTVSISRPAVVIGLLNIFILSASYLNYRQKTNADVTVLPDRGKYVITYSWDNSTIEDIVENAKYISRLPIDGIVIKDRLLPRIQNKGSIMTELFNQSGPVYQESDFVETISQIQRLMIAAPNLKHSFLPVYLLSHNASFDVDSHWDEQIYENWRMVARLIKKSNLDGLFIDSEFYGDPVLSPRMFDYPETYNGKSLSSMTEEELAETIKHFQDQATRRGRDLANILNEEFTDRQIDIILTITPSWHAVEGRSWSDEWKTSNYEMLAPFMDGLLMAAGPNVRINDGFERSYGYKSSQQNSSRSQFQRALDFIKGPDGAAKYSQDPESYKTIKASYGLWIDNSQQTPWYHQENDNWYKLFFNEKTYRWVDEPVDDGSYEYNYFSPSLIQDSLSNALRLSDRYVWLYYQRFSILGVTKYDQQYSPWRRNVDQEYVNALRRAQEYQATNSAPNWLTTIEAQTVVAGHDWRLEVPSSYYSDVDSDVVVLNVKSAPSGLQHSSRNRLSWSPGSDDIGQHSVTLRISDGVSLTDQSFAINVLPSKPSFVNQSQPVQTSVRSGEVVQLNINFTNEGNDYARNVTLHVPIPNNCTVDSSMNVVDNQVVIEVPDMAPRDSYQTEVMFLYTG